MRKPLLAAVFLSIVLPVPFAGPAFAQQADRVLVIFGNDKCPTNASGEEIVVCSRRPLRASPDLAQPFVTPAVEPSYCVRAPPIAETPPDTMNAMNCAGSASTCSTALLGTMRMLPAKL